MQLFKSFMSCFSDFLKSQHAAIVFSLKAMISLAQIESQALGRNLGQQDGHKVLKTRKVFTFFNKSPGKPHRENL